LAQPKASTTDHYLKLLQQPAGMGKIMFIFFTALSCSHVFGQAKDSLPDSDTTKIKSSLLKQVTVTGKRPPVQLLADRTIVNVDASVTNAGATLLEVLEKSPGITMDRNGNISLRGRQGVTIMVDGKPAQLSGTDLNNFLSGLTAAQVDQIEIIDNPSSKFDAAGNAGIINIKTKKNRQRGFNGNINLSAGQGRYTRTVNSLALNRYQGKFNLFANLTFNVTKNFSNLYALRKYYEPDNKTITALLEQPSFFTGKGPSQSLKTGIDYFLDKNTTLGASFTGSSFARKITGNNDAVWMNAAGEKDSVISTRSNNSEKLRNGGVNINARHWFSATKELTADFDYLGYKINNSQHFTNHLDEVNGYEEDLTGSIPSAINIFTGKADYTQSFGKGMKLEAGWKSSHVQTNNRAEYFYNNGSGVQQDLGKTNHFLYTENIHALYASLEKHTNKVTLHGGLRYERTNYDAEQLGNAMRQDSSFSRNYGDLFPNALASVQLDSFNTLSLTAGRRIDRPPFQSLNPFIFVINKYTYQSGNPFYKPQYTWNTELTHTFKNILVTSLSYSITHDYFSQIFLTDSTGIFYYTEGNLDKMENLGLSVSAQVSPFKWWSLSGQVAVNYKKIKGFVWNERMASLTQMTFNVNNQFKFDKGWSGELSGFFTTREQELQEITDPTGQVSAGVAKLVLNNRGTVKILVRDIFYTQAMKGNTTFKMATEYFKITRDSRFASVAFTYRFGKWEKSSTRKTGAEEEMRRVNRER
jgi:iron complex outermembrane receptor protein